MKRARIYEVGPRDGLQNEKQVIPTDIKVELINRLSETGLTHIEATSFVSPKWVPQMGDAADVMTRIKRKTGVTYPVLVPNDKGMDGAIAAKATEIAVFAAASESFSQKNINCTIGESLDRFRPVVTRAKEQGMTVRGYVSCVVGCPYEGDIAPAAVARVAKALREMGCYEVSLGDTIGVGTPEKINAMLDAVLPAVPATALAIHCHDTYGRALVNIEAALKRGVIVIDSSVAGLGGCPYAPGASGNVATEKVLHMLIKMGIETGVNRSQLIEAAEYISNFLNNRH